ELAGASPVVGEHRRGVANPDRLAVLVLDDFPRLEAALAFTAEEVQVAGSIGAREEVRMAVAVKVHELWSEADASGREDGAELVPGPEPLELAEAGLGLGAEVGVEAQLAFAELADEQAGLAV